MQHQRKTVPQATADHHCCLWRRLSPQIHPLAPVRESNSGDSNNGDLEIDQRRILEAYLLRKLERYSRERSGRRFHLTSLARLRRRLKRDRRNISKEFLPHHVSEEKILQWIDETFAKLDSYLPKLQSIIHSQHQLKHILSNHELFALPNSDNQWKQLQMQRAKIVLSGQDHHEQDLLFHYREYIFEHLTPARFNDDDQRLTNFRKIDLDSKYKEAETVGREHLKSMFDEYRRRQHPNIDLIKEMIQIGMEQMTKRPRTDDFYRVSMSSNTLQKMFFILKSKNAYFMSLKNIADDFMYLRFGHSLGNHTNSKDPIRERFVMLIHQFLNTISVLLKSMQPNSLEVPSSLFAPWNSNLPSANLLSPLIFVDQWTWLLEKWKIALQSFPLNLTRQGAFGRLVRTTIGVAVARLYSFAENNEQDELDEKLFQALQMGFYFGMAYALVDGFQDDQHGKEQFDINPWLIDMERILSGEVLDRTSLPQLPVTSLLLETYYSLINLTSANSVSEQTFDDLALLLRSQRCDKKDANALYDNDIDLYLGPLLKSHFTYTATASLGGVHIAPNDERLWIMPFLGQLTDDCRDFSEDRQNQSITPVTYYAQHGDVILNPFWVFLFVCEDLYVGSEREKNTGAFLGRRIMRTLRSLGSNLDEFLTIFTAKSPPEFCRYILSLEHLFDRVSDPEKAIFRSVNKYAIKYSVNHRKLETFAYDHLPLIERELFVKVKDHDPLVLGMNHSLKAGGKRLRPLLLLMVAQLYDLEIKRVLPLARAIEYLHTSSLIFDDLPAQDNAPLRRGQPTLHMPIDGDREEIPSTLSEGRAQLAAVNLIGYAIQSVTVDLNREGFSYESINRVTAELSQSMSELCHGQFLDLQAARTKRSLTIDDLDQIARLKTGKAIEIVLVCSVILAGKDESVLARLRDLGQLMGILFQMKDDLLDLEGTTDELGKPTHIDQQNHTMTYISLLGREKTRRRISTMRKYAEIIVDDLWPQAGTIRDVIRYICERNK